MAASPALLAPSTATAAPAAVAHVRARGILADRDIVESGIRVLDRSRSHTVLVIEVGGRPALVVKELGDDDLQGSGTREAATYALASTDPALAPLVPRWHGPDPRWLVLDAVVADSALDRMVASGVRDTAAATALGSVLGCWHANAAGAQGLPGAPPWVFGLLAADRPGFVDSNEGARAFVADARGRVDLAGLVERAARRWTASTVIHGDVRLDNCLVRGGGEGAVLIDWETAGRGDPAWDVAAVVQELLTLTGRGDLEAATRDAATCLRALQGGYRATSAQAVDDRLGAFTAARLLQRAVQVSSWDPRGRTAETDRLLALATQVSGRTGAWWEPG